MMSSGGGGVVGDVRTDTELLQDLLLDLGGDVRVFLEELAGVFLALAELVAVVRIPGAGLADDACSTPTSMSEPSREMPWP